MKVGYARERSLIVEATKSVTLHGRREWELRSRLEDPASDCTFEELHFDSLARMELCIWMQTEAGVELDESEILAHPSVNALAAYLAGKGAAS